MTHDVFHTAYFKLQVAERIVHLPYTHINMDGHVGTDVHMNIKLDLDVNIDGSTLHTAKPDMVDASPSLS